jgi:hypothetical protein
MTSIDPGLSALIGAGVGAVAAIVGTIIGQHYQTKRLKTATFLRQKEKLTEKRINAHEKIIELADLLNNTASYSENLEAANGSMVRGPVFLESTNIYRKWFHDTFNPHIQNLVWLTPKVRSEIHLLQNYLVNLYGLIENLDESKVQKIGVAIKDDFILFANNLRNWSQEYISHNALLLDTQDIDTSWKYDNQTINRRLNKTTLFKQFINSKDSRQNV